MKLTDEQTYEMVHSKLNVLDLTDDISGTQIGNNAIISDSPTQIRRKKSSGKQTTLTMGSTMANTHDQSNSKKTLGAVHGNEDEQRESMLQNFNKKVWRPWWDNYLAKCEEFIAAAKNGDYDAVAQLMNQEFASDMAVNVNYQEKRTGYSALHYAVLRADTKLVNLLVKNFADVKAQDEKKQNPLHLVCISGNLEIFKILLNACYCANEGIDVEGKTPLEYARQY